MPDMIAQSRLAEIWRVPPSIPTFWQATGAILPYNDPEDDEVYYSTESIDALHASMASNIADGSIPTIRQLLDEDTEDQRSLLLMAEVAQWMGRSEPTVIRAMASGRLPVLYVRDGRPRYHSMPRFPRSLLAAKFAGQQELLSSTVRTQTASQILCVNPNFVRALVKAGRLEQVHIEERPTYLYISRTSILALLRELLTSCITPERWWELRLTRNERMFTKEEVIEECRIAHKTLTPMVENGKIVCIRTPGSGERQKQRTLFPESVVKNLKIARSRVSPQLVALLFAVHEQQAANWLKSCLLNCPDHTGPLRDRCPLPSCLAAYIERHANKPLNGEEWFLKATRDRIKVVSKADVAKRARTTIYAVGEALANGYIAGIRLPTLTPKGQWVFLVTDAFTFIEGKLREKVRR